MENEENSNKNINNEKYAKYKEMYDKYKNEDGMLSEKGINEILNECGRKTTLKESEELINLFILYLHLSLYFKNLILKNKKNK